MRNRAIAPEEKRAVLDRILAAWLRVPGLRLGQLLENSMPIDHDIFYAEDVALVKFVELALDKFGHVAPAPKDHNLVFEGDYLGWTSKDAKRLTDTLTAAQEASTRDLLDARNMRAIVNAPPGLAKALADVVAERRRQDDKWGPIGDPKSRQNALAIPDGTGIYEGQYAESEIAREVCDDAFENGAGTWADILREEFCESLAESDPEKLRAELVQVAAVACKWVEVLDLRAKGKVDAPR